MTARLFRAIFPALAFVAVPVALTAQAPAAPADSGPNQEQVQAWVTELQEIGGQLQTIQRQAMQDPELSSQQEAIGADIKAAMEALNPAIPEQMTRMETLETEAAAAQQSGDTQKLQALAMEAQQIQQGLSEAQEQALQQPAISAKVNAFQTRLEAKMAELDPGAPQLIARFRELENQVMTALYGQQQPS